MEKITILGTGAAMVTQCYNTCFTISDNNEHFLVDAGGGNGILVQLEKANIPIAFIHNAFISHNHSDHLLGMIWIVRAITQLIKKDKYQGNFTIFGHTSSLEAIDTISKYVMQPRLTALFGSRIILHPIIDGDCCCISGHDFHFFDIHSSKMMQHGFKYTLNSGKQLAFLGDEPFNEINRPIIQNSEIIMQDALCLYGERDIFKPQEKHHGTALDACQNAASLGAETTILYHTNDKTLSTRRADFMKEGSSVFKGNIIVPDDLDTIYLD